ncbi:VOC family protein [Rhodococcus rhodnii]|uniref:VOC family protein n=2 Tax=Rhodococcus rhodnii TaxID=38312 RepID=A0A6P2CAD3_9NOCA|nr:VOC family protein [Rhodococcus rhodnii]EOM74567.1 putative 3-demethylubiquinone-9 3-methyltransferase [Rhodococcus rhodnii LMG 5362]TXG89717.1 VOC family protein [Rhodococcus rhodnii]
MKPITPCLWFDGDAEAAATFYTDLFDDSWITHVDRYPSGTPGGAEGEVMTVSFELRGSPFIGLNGGPAFTFSEAVSFEILCDGQAEVDRYWDAFLAGGGVESQCGWLKDRWGVSWQVVPERLYELMRMPDRDAVNRMTAAMMTMKRLDQAALERAFGGEAVPS